MAVGYYNFTDKLSLTTSVGVPILVCDVNRNIAFASRSLHINGSTVRISVASSGRGQLRGGWSPFGTAGPGLGVGTIIVFKASFFSHGGELRRWEYEGN